MPYGGLGGKQAPGLCLLQPGSWPYRCRRIFFNIGRFKRLKVASIYGKSPYRRQERELRQKTHVVVGTPGRIIDHIERGTLDTSCIKYLVLDEADEMLSMGFVSR